MGTTRTGGEPMDNTPAPTKLFPKWSAVEQDFWIDRFEALTDSLIEQYDQAEPKDTDDPRYPVTPSGSWYTDRIKLAAQLADEATKEMIYRFERQRPIPRQQKPAGGEDDRPKKKKRLPW